MIQRFVLLVLAALGLALWLRRLFAALGAAAPRRPERPRGTGSPAPVEGAMVRDRVCDTFLPRSRAIVEPSAAGEVYFCSERCRQRFLAENRGATPSGA